MGGGGGGGVLQNDELNTQKGGKRDVQMPGRVFPKRTAKS